MTLRFLATAAIAALLGAPSSAQTIGCEVGVANGGLIPAAGTGDGTFPGTLPTAPSVFQLNVPSIPAGANVVTEVKLFGLTHTWLSDVQLVLTDPGGTSHNLWVRGPSGISSCDWNGDYTIVPACVGLGQVLPASCTGVNILPPGAYDQFFGTGTTSWPSGTNNIFNTQLDTIPAAPGVWTLTAYDWAAGDTGTLASFDVCFGTAQAQAIPTAAPALTAPANGASVFGPVVNLSWGAVPCATSYEVDVDGSIFATASTTLAYNSAPGGHTWMARGVNASGAGPWSTPRTFTDLGAAPTPCTGQELATPTPFPGNNGLGTNSVVYFDVDVLNPAGITVSQFDTNATATAGTAFTLEVWTKTGTYTTSMTDPLPWTMVSTGAGVAIGTDVAPGSLVDVTDFVLPPGVTGMALRIIGAGHRYQNGTGANQFVANADLSITLGHSQATMFSSTPFTPRCWMGTLRYNCTDFTAYCFGDGTGTACPCGNTGGAGEGCANGTGSGGVLAGSGSSSIGAGDLVLSGSNLVPGQPGLYFQGDNATGGGNGFVNGDGLRCAGGNIRRLQVRTANASGDSNTTINIGVAGAVSAGDVKRYQLWYRDPVTTPCATTFNLTNGLEITWAP